MLVNVWDVASASVVAYQPGCKTVATTMARAVAAGVVGANLERPPRSPG